MCELRCHPLTLVESWLFVSLVCQCSMFYWSHEKREGKVCFTPRPAFLACWGLYSAIFSVIIATACWWIISRGRLHLRTETSVVVVWVLSIVYKTSAWYIGTITVSSLLEFKLSVFFRIWNCACSVTRILFLDCLCSIQCSKTLI